MTLNPAATIELLKLVVSSATFVSILIAYLAYQANQKKIEIDRIRDHDKELVAQLQRSLQWAYDVLTEEGKRLPPVPNRLNWLTCARHLLRCQKLGEEIRSATYKTVYAEIEEYWRHRFYTALSHEALRAWTYFSDQERPSWPENIEISSALVIVGFSGWKEGVADPTDTVDRAGLLAGSGGKGSTGRGLRDYIARLDEIKQKTRTDGSV